MHYELIPVDLRPKPVGQKGPVGIAAANTSDRHGRKLQKRLAQKYAVALSEKNEETLKAKQALENEQGHNKLLQQDKRALTSDLRNAMNDAFLFRWQRDWLMESSHHQRS